MVSAAAKRNFWPVMFHAILIQSLLASLVGLAQTPHATWRPAITLGTTMEQLANLALPAGVVMITLFLILRLVKRRKQSAGQPITTREHIERAKQARGVRGDLEQIMVEVEQVAKRLSAQLDAKAMRLEQMIAQADERIAELKDVQGESENTPRQSDRLEEIAKAQQDTSTDLFRHPGGSDKVGGSSADDPLAKSVFELAAAGNSAEQIASSLGEHVGKVELILALRNAGND